MHKYFIVGLFLTGCGSITPEHYELAERLCENHGGVKTVFVSFDYPRKVECRAGVTITEWDQY